MSMNASDFFEQLQQRVSEVLAMSPAADIRQNLKAVVSQQLAAFDLVTREEFDDLQAVLLATRERLEQLEARLAAAAADAPH